MVLGIVVKNERMLGCWKLLEVYSVKLDSIILQMEFCGALFIWWFRVLFCEEFDVLLLLCLYRGGVNILSL